MEKYHLLVLMVVPISGYDYGEPQYAVFIKREIENLTVAGMKVIPLYLSSRFNYNILRSFRQEVKEAITFYKPDILHIQTGTAGLFLLGSGITIPTLVTIGGSEILGYPGINIFWQFRGKLAAIASRLVCKRVDQVVVVSENLAHALPKRLNNPAQIIPRAVNTGFFEPVESSEARQLLQWEEETYYVAFSDPRPDMKVKNRPLAEKVICQVSKALKQKVELAVIYQKTPEQVRLMLNAADALLVTSLHEGSPNIVKEAMACNLPVISVPCGDVQARLSEVNPSQVISYDVQELSLALTEVLRNRLRSNGRKILYQQGLSTESVAHQLQTIYQELNVNN